MRTVNLSLNYKVFRLKKDTNKKTFSLVLPLIMNVTITTPKNFGRMSFITLANRALFDYPELQLEHHQTLNILIKIM